MPPSAAAAPDFAPPFRPWAASRAACAASRVAEASAFLAAATALRSAAAACLAAASAAFFAAAADRRYATPARRCSSCWRLSATSAARASFFAALVASVFDLADSFSANHRRLSLSINTACVVRSVPRSHCRLCRPAATEGASWAERWDRDCSDFRFRPTESL